MERHLRRFAFCLFNAVHALYLRMCVFRPRTTASYVHMTWTLLATQRRVTPWRRRYSERLKSGKHHALASRIVHWGGWRSGCKSAMHVLYSVLYERYSTQRTTSKTKNKIIIMKRVTISARQIREHNKELIILQCLFLIFPDSIFYTFIWIYRFNVTTYSVTGWFN